MPLKNIDYLSTKISLFYYGRRRHSAIFGGVLTILMVLSCLIYIFYLFLDVYRHKSSIFQYYRHIFEDPGVYLFNNTEGIFHFFQFYNPKNNSYFSKYNSKYIRLFMASISEDYKKNPRILSEYDHWVYDNCRDGIDNKYFVQNIFKNVSFKDGICIRYYYNNIDKKYYSIEDSKNFIYPQLANIELNMNYSITTIIEKCDNNSILTEALGLCADENEIEDYLNVNNGLNFNVLEYEINPENYTNQIYYFIYGISNIIQKSKIIENNIIFVPLKTDIKGGVLFPKRNQKTIYSFYDYYRRDEDIINNKKILSIYNFGLSPSGYVFKSNYETLYDCFPKMGGIIQLIYYIFFGINFFYNRFTIINDTKRLFFQLNNNDRANRNIQIMQFSNAVYSLRRASSKMASKYSILIKKGCQSNEPNFIHSNSNIFKFSQKLSNCNIKKDFDIEGSKNISIFPNSNQNISQFKSNLNLDENLKKSNNILKEELCSSINKNKNEINKENEESIIGLINNIKADNEQKSKISDILEIKKLSKKIETSDYFMSSMLNKNNIDKDIIFLKILLQKYFAYKKKSFIYENTSLEEINKFFSFTKYLYSSFCYKKAKRYHYVLDNFRKKLLSEEHFFRTHNYLYLFEKYFDIQESQKIDIIELYKNL